MSETEEADLSPKASSVFSSVNIVTGTNLRENIEEAIKLWIETVGLIEPKLLPYTNSITGEFFEGHESVLEFTERIKSHRAAANRGSWTGAVMTRKDNNPDNQKRDAQLVFVGEIPPLLFTIMERAFGTDWQTHPDVWREFKKLFTIGNMNPNPKVIR